MSYIKKFKKLLNWSSWPRPDIDLDPYIYQELRPFRIPIILTVLVMLFGTIGYIVTSDFSLMDAIFQTGITFTTVGFGETAPIPTAGRFFSIFLIIVGFAIFSSCIGIAVQVATRGVLISLIKERHMLYKIARLKNHFVVCYHNELTIELTKQFRENHIPFVVIDPSPSLESYAETYKYLHYIQAEPHTEIALLKAHLSSAKGVLTLSHNFADNIALITNIRLYEKEVGLRRPLQVISHANNELEGSKLVKLGADSIVTPAILVAKRLASMSIRPDMNNMIEEILYKKDSPIDMEEVFIPAHSWVRFKKIKDLRLRDFVNVSIVGIMDNKGKFISMPKGDVLIGTDSKILVIGTPENIKQTKRLVAKREKPEELDYV